VRLALYQLVITLTVQLLKAVVARKRPYQNLAGVIPARIEQDASFPSGHSAAAFAMSLILSDALPMLGPLLFGLAVLIGYSRIYRGVHYPSDVLAGSLLGWSLTLTLFAIFPIRLS
jgi:undecaprenyl-diphosphatase